MSILAERRGNDEQAKEAGYSADTGALYLYHALTGICGYRRQSHSCAPVGQYVYGYHVVEMCKL